MRTGLRLECASWPTGVLTIAALLRVVDANAAGAERNPTPASPSSDATVGAPDNTPHASSSEPAPDAQEKAPPGPNQEGGDASTDNPSRYWASQKSGFFLGGHVGVGFVSRASLQVGYGKPHYMWAGIEGTALTSPGFNTLALGALFRFLAINVDAALLRTTSYTRSSPLRALSYDSGDLERPGAPKQAFDSFETSIYGYIPAGPLLGYWEFVYDRVFNPPGPDQANFHEIQTPVLEEPEAFSGRYAIYLTLLDGNLNLGPAYDFVSTPNREAVHRLGGSANWTFSNHWSATVHVTTPLSSPDDLGLNQMWGIARLRYTFATGEAKPGLW